MVQEDKSGRWSVEVSSGPQLCPSWSRIQGKNRGLNLASLSVTLNRRELGLRNLPPRLIFLVACGIKQLFHD